MQTCHTTSINCNNFPTQLDMHKPRSHSLYTLYSRSSSFYFSLSGPLPSPHRQRSLPNWRNPVWKLAAQATPVLDRWVCACVGQSRKFVLKLDFIYKESVFVLTLLTYSHLRPLTFDWSNPKVNHVEKRSQQIFPPSLVKHTIPCFPG